MKHGDCCKRCPSSVFSEPCIASCALGGDIQNMKKKCTHFVAQVVDRVLQYTTILCVDKLPLSAINMPVENVQASWGYPA